MSKFTQLGYDFSIQEFNWIKGGLQIYRPRGYVDSLEILKAHLVRRVDTATDYSTPVADLDFNDFDKIINGLPSQQRKVYIAENIRTYINQKSDLIRHIPRDRSPWGFLGVSKYIYERTLNDAIANIKRRGGLV